MGKRSEMENVTSLSRKISLDIYSPYTKESCDCFGTNGLETDIDKVSYALGGRSLRDINAKTKVLKHKVEIICVTRVRMV